MTNIVMLVNLELILGFMFEIKSIPNYLYGQMILSMSFTMGNLLEQVE